MKQTVIAVFAHPDDEAFGPAGTLVLLSQKYKVILLCATKGEKGEDNIKDKNLGNKIIGEIREEELRRSARILGINDVFFLGFVDGTLSNNIYHKLVDKISLYVNKYKPTILLTYEHRGVSGHIDHVVVSFATSFVFEKYSFVKKIMYHCISTKHRSLIDKYFIYFPPGYLKKEVDEIIDVTSVFRLKKKAIYAHKSQLQDIGKHISPIVDRLGKEEWFITRSKGSIK